MQADLVQGDTGSVIQVTCTDSVTNSPINLTGSTISIKWRDSTGVTLITKAMTIVSALAGTCKYQFATGELYPPAMTFEVTVTDSGGKTLTNLDLIDVNVRPQL